MQRGLPHRATRAPGDHERRAAAPGHRRSGHHHRAGHPDDDRVLELQRLAGNAAVARSLVGQRRNGRVIAGVDTIQVRQHPMPPEGGLKSIRDMKKGAGIMGYTIREISDNPPILRPESPAQSEKGWTVKARPVAYVGEPKFEEYWPTQGRHKLADRNYMAIDHDWETKLHQGEDEHVSDATLAWEQTWKLVAAVINRLAKEAGPPKATPEAATQDLYERYRKALPEPDLHPEGARPDEDAQRKVLSPDDGTLFWWMFQTTVVRDTRGYHQPETTHTFEGETTIGHLAKGKSEIPGPKSDKLLAEVRKKFKPGKKIQGT